MKKLVVIIERTKDGFSVYAQNESFAGMGETKDEAIADMKAGIAHFVQYAKETGRAKYSEYLDNAFEIEERYDIPSMLEYYGEFITDTGLSKLTGIDKTQIWRYTHGKATPRPAQRQKIVDGLHKLAMELSAISL